MCCLRGNKDLKDDANVYGSRRVAFLMYPSSRRYIYPFLQLSASSSPICPALRRLFVHLLPVLIAMTHCRPDRLDGVWPYSCSSTDIQNDHSDDLS